jgi:hypothetical protein
MDFELTGFVKSIHWPRTWRGPDELARPGSFTENSVPVFRKG